MKKKERELLLRLDYEIDLEEMTPEQCKQWLEGMFYYRRTGEILENIDSEVRKTLKHQIREREEDKSSYYEVCEKRRKAVETRRNKEKEKGIHKDTNVYKGIQCNTNDTNSNSNSNINKKENIKEKKVNRFEEFWKEYPLKKGKPKAMLRYKLVVGKGVSEDLLIQKAKEYAEECKIKNTEQQYIKRAEGWLNSGRYEDDYITAKPKQVKTEDKPYDFTQKPTLIRPKLPGITNLKKDC